MPPLRQRLPVLATERHAGDEHDRQVGPSDVDTDASETGMIASPALPVQHPKPGRLDPAGRLSAPVGMHHQVPVARQQQVGGASRPHIAGELGECLQLSIETPSGPRCVIRGQALHEAAKGDFRVSFTHGTKVPHPGFQVVGRADMAVVREDVKAPAQLARKGLGIGQRDRPLSGMPNVGYDRVAP